MSSCKYNILVSGASGIVGYGILRALKKYNSSLNLIGTTIYPESPANIFSDIFIQAPLTSSENYIDWLNETIKKYNVDMIIPGIEADMIKWNDNRSILENGKNVLLLNNPELINLCVDKWKFYEKVKSFAPEYAIETSLEPEYERHADNYGLPFLLKPRRGFASRGIQIIDNEADFRKIQSRIGHELMVQPIVGTSDEEYTTSAFFDADSKLCSFMTLRRKLAKEGYTEKAVVADPDGVIRMLETLADGLKPVGPTNFQFRMEDNAIKLLEVNPRISSSTSIRTGFGYNESGMAVDYFLDKNKIKQPFIKKGWALRFTEDYISYENSDNF